jgi:hypothetical protein
MQNSDDEAKGVRLYKTIYYDDLICFAMKEYILKATKISDNQQNMDTLYRDIAPTMKFLFLDPYLSFTKSKIYHLNPKFFSICYMFDLFMYTSFQ